MRYTPVELRHVKLAKSFRGYKAAEVEKLLLDVADSFEEVWRERGELVDKLQDVEKVLADVKARETLLGLGTASICGRRSRRLSGRGGRTAATREVGC